MESTDLISCDGKNKDGGDQLCKKSLTIVPNEKQSDLEITRMVSVFRFRFLFFSTNLHRFNKREMK